MAVGLVVGVGECHMTRSGGCSGSRVPRVGVAGWLWWRVVVGQRAFSRAIVVETQVCLDRVFPTNRRRRPWLGPRCSAFRRSSGSCSACCAASAPVAEAARRNKCSETSITKWRDQFVQAGLSALEAGAVRGPSAREAQLARELEGVMTALGEAHVRLRLLDAL